jgi:hypothetical protein
MGTVSGMVLTSGLGIFVGSRFGSRLSDGLLKLVSTTVFTIFGIIKIVYATPDGWVNVLSIIGFATVIIILVILLGRRTIIYVKSTRLTGFQKAAQRLYDYYHTMEIQIEDICRGTSYCGECKGSNCAIGYLKALAKQSIENQDSFHNMSKEEMISNKFSHENLLTRDIEFVKDKFETGLLVHILAITLKTLKISKEPQIEYMREIIEMLLFEKTLHRSRNFKGYINQVMIIDSKIANMLKNEMNGLS